MGLGNFGVLKLDKRINEKVAEEKYRPQAKRESDLTPGP